MRLLNYTTDTFDKREWEAHRREIDLHVVLAGSEKIYLAGSEKLIPGEYHDADDYYLLTGESQNFIILPANEFLILWPNEAHKTGVGEEPAPVKKFVFKIQA